MYTQGVPEFSAETLRKVILRKISNKEAHRECLICICVGDFTSILLNPENACSWHASKLEHSMVNSDLWNSLASFLLYTSFGNVVFRIVRATFSPSLLTFRSNMPPAALNKSENSFFKIRDN